MPRNVVYSQPFESVRLSRLNHPPPAEESQMPADRALTCPRCTTLIEVAPLIMPLLDEASGEVTGAVLKRCPSCRAWSWMTPERQAAR